MKFYPRCQLLSLESLERNGITSDLSNVVLVVEMAVALLLGGTAVLSSLAIGLAAFLVARSHFPILAGNLVGRHLRERSLTSDHSMANETFPSGYAPAFLRSRILRL